MSSLISDGFIVLLAYLWPVFVFLFSTAGFGLWIARPFTRSRNHSSLQTITLSILLGIIGLSFLFLVFIAFGRLWPAALTIGAWFIALGGFGLLVAWVAKHGRRLVLDVKWLPLAAGAVAFLLLLLLRLAFLRALLAPPYADSPYHYLLTSRLLNPSIPLNAIIPGSYYHLGFHVLSSWMAALSGRELLTVLPLNGQVLLAVLPLSVYALALSLTGERSPARISALAAALLWSMPAFAANWAKYPAISAIILFPAVCATLLLLGRQKGKKALLIIAILVLLIGITWFHTRIFALLIYAGVATAVVAFVLKSIADVFIRIIGGLAWIGCAFLYLNTPFYPLIYNGNHFLSIIGVILLLPCALIVQPRATLGIGLFTIFTMASFYLHLPAWIHLPAASLLDEQFLVMSVFLPFSLVIGIGSSGLIHWIHNKLVKVLAWLILVFWIFASAANVPFYTPHSCCNFVSESDKSALEWMKTELPAGSTIYITGIEKADGLIGSDAGVWVTPLTGLSSRLLPYDYAWFSGQVHSSICPLAPAYLYAGHQPYSFQIDANTHPDWYELVFERTGTSIYRIIPCNP